MDRSTRPKKIAVLIVAAGTGTRFGSPLPKQYIDLDSKPLLRHSIDVFLRMGITNVVAVIHPDHADFYAQAIKGLDILDPVMGGSTRAESTLAGLNALKNLAPDYVLVHDAARPFVDSRLIEQVLDGLTKAAGCIPAIAVTDTIKLVANNHIQQTLPRENLWRAQTPQGFHYPVLLDCFTRTTDNAFTDEASLLEKFNIPVIMVPGSEENIKITFSRDLKGS
ncbi:MAG: 2-C-methyl-D-erythritol 4-phosphate cytidylyltransferase [Candidatus Paracaedibacteraceae bacterium]|nr:2-C-methyl-D-erythritol 4-phosphate cytidylyltransferase [Candidatus Paracaedibacteraceae bacterium]